MIDAIFWLFTVVGVFVSGYFGVTIIAEVVRAIRQGHRIATVHTRLTTPRRKTSMKMWWRAIKLEFFDSYSEKGIWRYRIPHDPNKPIYKGW
jgi:hypothetical protein